MWREGDWRQLWDFPEDDLLRCEDGSLAAAVWESGSRASGGEVETEFRWAVWDEPTGEQLGAGSCDFCSGRWGRSGKYPTAARFEGRTLVVTTSEGEERVEPARPSGVVARGERVVHLSLRGAPLAPAAAAELARGPRARTATGLDLRGTRLGGEGARALAEGRGLRRLERLLLTREDVDDAGLELLRRRFGERLELAEGAQLDPSDRPPFTRDEYVRALAATEEALRARGHDTARVQVGPAATAITAALRGDGPPPALAVSGPGGAVVPRDPLASLTITPECAGTHDEVVALTLECHRSVADQGLAVLDELRRHLAAVRRAPPPRPADAPTPPPAPAARSPGRGGGCSFALLAALAGAVLGLWR